MNFADVKNDIAFRKIFGDENKKEVLISFLNAVLGLQGKECIKSITILNPYQLPELKGGKVSIIDVKAKDQRKHEYIIEMQVAEQDSFNKRSLFYTTKSYNDQIKRGDKYRTLKPVIFIGILNFRHTKNPHYISRNIIMDKATGEHSIKDIEFNFVELPKFTKKAHELESLVDKWIYFIKNAEKLDLIPEDVDDEGLKIAYKSANKSLWQKEEVDAYDYVFMREEDARAAADFRVNKAIEEAEAKANQVILGMVNAGLPASQIALITQKTEEDVQQIIAKHKE